MIPKIVFCKELPGWIRSSNIAAYHPATNIIYVTKTQTFFKIIKSLFHELIHFIGHQLDGPSHWVHKIIDGGSTNYI